MIQLVEGGQLFRCGIAVMVLAAVLALICIIIFTAAGRRIKRQLEEEYGKPQR